MKNIEKFVSSKLIFLIKGMSKYDKLTKSLYLVITTNAKVSNVVFTQIAIKQKKKD